MSPTRHAEPLLAASGISKRYGATAALVDADLTAESGSLHALLGGNGSGKSTMIKTLAGVVTADEGSVRVGDDTTDIRTWDPKLAYESGLRFVHQDLALFPNATVAENVCVAHAWPLRGIQIRWSTLWRRTAGVLEQILPHVSPRTNLANLSPAQQTMVAIARALVTIPQDQSAVLLLDEPTAVLPAHEVVTLFDVLHSLATQGHAVLYVTHRLEEVIGVADTISVFRDGRSVGAVGGHSVDEPELVGMIVGRAKLPDAAGKAPLTHAAEPELVVDGVSTDRLHDISFTAAPGEIIGIAGLADAGGSDLLRSLFGVIPSKGRVTLAGTPIKARSAADATRRQIAYIPPDRAMDAVFGNMTVNENVSVGSLRAFWSNGKFRWGKLRRAATSVLDEHNVKRPGLDAPISALSGGNQQKVVLGRWLRQTPRLLLLDEPTQGVDVLARADIWKSVRRLATSGAIVLAHSSDYEELVTVTDRIIVLHSGRLTNIVYSSDIDRHDLTELAYRADSA